MAEQIPELWDHTHNLVCMWLKRFFNHVVGNRHVYSVTFPGEWLDCVR